MNNKDIEVTEKIIYYAVRVLIALGIAVAATLIYLSM